MLRLISVIGIAIAMVIGFVAISSQMKDDYNVRSQVVDVLKQMKTLAAEELQCEASSEPESNIEPTEPPAVEISAAPDITPLPNDQQSSSIPEQESSDIDSNQNPDAQSENIETTTEPTNESDNALEAIDVDRNSEIVKTMGYRVINDGDVEVVVIFKDVKGETGKIRIKSDSRIIINCNCVAHSMSCKTAESNINKNYLPKTLTR